MRTGDRDAILARPMGIVPPTPGLLAPCVSVEHKNAQEPGADETKKLLRSASRPTSRNARHDSGRASRNRRWGGPLGREGADRGGQEKGSEGAFPFHCETRWWMVYKGQGSGKAVCQDVVLRVVARANTRTHTNTRPCGLWRGSTSLVLPRGPCIGLLPRVTSASDATTARKTQVRDDPTASTTRARQKSLRGRTCVGRARVRGRSGRNGRFYDRGRNCQQTGRNFLWVSESAERASKMLSWVVRSLTYGMKFFFLEVILIVMMNVTVMSLTRYRRFAMIVFVFIFILLEYSVHV